MGLVPDAKMTYRNFFEIIAESLYRLTESVMGHHEAPIYFPLIGTLFIYILTCNLMGLIPGRSCLRPKTSIRRWLWARLFSFITTIAGSQSSRHR